MSTALTTYRSALPAARFNQIERLGSAILRTLDRVGIKPGPIGVVFSRICLHCGQFITYAIETRDLSVADQHLILSKAIRNQLASVLQQRVAVLREEHAILIVIDLRPTRRERLRHWWQRVSATHFYRGGQR